MCGLVALFGRTDALEKINQMNDAIIHRGPDGEGYWHGENVAIGHRRLSIIDIEHGAQPMVSQGGEWVVAFNGEIYNYRDLKSSRYRDYNYQTSSDTEVIVAGLDIEGVGCFHHFNGMFAIVAYHISSGKVYFGRDARGIKPLYFSQVDGQLSVASEIKPLLQTLPLTDVDIDGLYDFLSLRYSTPPVTIFDKVSKTLPGHLYCFDRRTHAMEQTEFAMTSPKINHDISEAQALETLTDVFVKAVDRHMIADVPVGMLLSGGVDSAAVAKAAVETNGRFQTFCIGYDDDSDANEFAEAEETARLLDTEHVNLTLTQSDAIEAMPKLIAHLEEPVVTTSTFSYYLLCHAVSKHKKVVLTGQGADEPWAGYGRHRVAFILDKVPNLLLGLARFGKGLLVKKDTYARLYDVMVAEGERERLAAFHRVFPNMPMRDLLQQDRYSDDLATAQSDRLAQYIKALPENGSLPERMLAFDTRTSLSENLLLLGDKLSMANSIEVRVPFLDKDYMAFVESLPFHLKRAGRSGNIGKYLHKKMCEQILPKDIVHRRKKGFQTPIAHWLEGHLRGHVESIVNAPNSFTQAYLQPTVVNQVLQAHSRENNLERQIFAVWALEEWYRQFI